MNNHKVKCSNFEISNDKPFTLIAGPCQLENEEHAIKVSTELKKITSELGINLIYKTSFEKANRTSLKGKRGMISEPVFLAKSSICPMRMAIGALVNTNRPPSS